MLLYFSCMLSGCSSSRLYEIHVISHDDKPVPGALVIVNDYSWLQYPFTFQVLQESVHSLFSKETTISLLDKKNKFPLSIIGITDSNGVAKIAMRKASWGSIAVDSCFERYGLTGTRSPSSSKNIVCTNRLDWPFLQSDANNVSLKLQHAVTYKSNPRDVCLAYMSQIQKLFPATNEIQQIEMGRTENYEGKNMCY